jgi:enoyl-CoA hydratase/carnithine racemase
MDRPAKRNALRLADWHCLVRALGELLEAEPNVLILRASTPGTFCAGSDLQEIAALTNDGPLRSEFQSVMHDARSLLAGATFSTLAAISGDCSGAGVALAMACDVRIANSAARFGITSAKFGISYPAEDIRRLLELVGPGQAARLLYAAETIDGFEATQSYLSRPRTPTTCTRSAVF